MQGQLHGTAYLGESDTTAIALLPLVFPTGGHDSCRLAADQLCSPCRVGPVAQNVAGKVAAALEERCAALSSCGRRWITAEHAEQRIAGPLARMAAKGMRRAHRALRCCCATSGASLLIRVLRNLMHRPRRH